ncbi:MAG: Uma2 family endonuclease [Sphaerospermopsis sp. SIO1G2]|nr:Uma2 family endonuclease [Sphaerospermopsis sp. SIO1G2]
MIQLKNKLTLEEFLSLPETDTIYELFDGTALPKYKNEQISPKFFHGLTTGSLFILLSKWSQNKGRIVIEWSVKLTRNKQDWISVPDLTYVSYQRLPLDWLKDEPCPVIPELVIEIISPGQTFGDMIEKATYYLQSGISLVWIVDTISQTITVLTSSSLPTTFRNQQVIRHELLPDLQITPTEVFKNAGLIP